MTTTSSSVRLTLRSAALAFLTSIIAGCSLGNVGVDACESDGACQAAFGVGSTCVDGYCSEPARCNSGHDCRAAHGGGACVEGTCRAELPADPVGACTAFEPADLPSRALAGEGAPILVGAMFLPGSDFSPPILDAARLAVREVNSVGGIGKGRPLGMVICDNGGADNALSGDARTERIHAVVDHLAGTLGVPFVVGPLTSGDSIFAISRAVTRRLPTAFVSPSATSPALTLEPDRLDASDPHGLFWRTAPSDQLQGAVLAKNVAGVFPAMATLARVAVAFRDDAYGQGLADAFQKAFPAKTSLVKFAIGAPLAAVVASAAATNPDALMFVDIGGDRAIEFITEMQKVPALASLPLYLADGSKNEALLDPKLSAPIRTIVFEQTVGTVAAAPEGFAFNVFQSSYLAEFKADPANSAFTANGYDAAYVGAAGLVFASQGGDAYDGRDVAAGMARLVPPGAEVQFGKVPWGALKSGLTSGDKKVDVVGVSGELDFDVATGEAPAPIEVWQPSTKAADCDGTPPCFKRLTVINP